MKTRVDQQYTLAELAGQAGVPARTIRFYIARGLVPGPARGGRGAVYGPDHLQRLEAIRSHQNRGLTLAEIARELGGEEAAVPSPSAWWSYPVGDGVTVWVRADATPWRLRQVRKALGEFTARLREAEQEEESDGGG